MRRLWLVALVLLAGCVQPPIAPADVQAKRFEPVADKSVIYIVRDHPDFTDAGFTVHLGESGRMITTYPGTYFRWEVPPGTHEISGYGPDTGAIRLTTEPGRIYYVLQRSSLGFFRFPQSQFRLIAEPYGRAAVNRSVLVGP